MGTDSSLALFESWEVDQSLLLDVSVQTDPHKTKTIWTEQGYDTHLFPLLLFEISTGAKSSKSLCQRSFSA